MLQLPDEYADACLGHTLDPLGPPRWVYSLNKVAEIKGKLEFIVAPEDAAEATWAWLQQMAAEHGTRMPVFVEDTTSREKQGPKIWTPGS